MPVETWSFVLVLDDDLQLLRVLELATGVHERFLAGGMAAALKRLAAARLASGVDGEWRLTEFGQRIVRAEPWYEGGGVSFFWHAPNSRPAGTLDL